MRTQILALLCLSLASCNYREEKGETTVPPAAGIPAADLNYANVRTKIFEPKCISCHGNGSVNGNVTLDTYAAASAASAKIANVTYGPSPRMPPGSKLPATDTSLLKAWIEAGAPEQAPDSGAPAGLSELETDDAEPLEDDAHDEAQDEAL